MPTNNNKSEQEQLGLADSPSFHSWADLYQEYLKEFDCKPGNREQLWVFRGQRDKKWSLQSSIQRELAHCGRHCDEWTFLEEGNLREFQRRLAAVDHRVPTPSLDNILGWMALMQHHGAPTRLLDFTFSFFVALFFAVESSDFNTDAAVYAIDARWCNRQARKWIYTAGCGQPNRPPSRQELDEIETRVARDTFITKPTTFRMLFGREVSLVYRVNAFMLNPRQAVQQGLFLCPGSLRRSFCENLAALRSYPHDRAETETSKDPIRKWVIPAPLHKEIVEQLSYMNIGRHSLFPGIDGLAQSMRHNLLWPGRLRPTWRDKLKTEPFERWSEWTGWDIDRG